MIKLDIFIAFPFFGHGMALVCFSVKTDISHPKSRISQRLHRKILNKKVRVSPAINLLREKTAAGEGSVATSSRTNRLAFEW